MWHLPRAPGRHWGSTRTVPAGPGLSSASGQRCGCAVTAVLLCEGWVLGAYGLRADFLGSLPWLSPLVCLRRWSWMSSGERQGRWSWRAMARRGRGPPVSRHHRGAGPGRLRPGVRSGLRLPRLRPQVGQRLQDRVARGWPGLSRARGRNPRWPGPARSPALGKYQVTWPPQAAKGSVTTHLHKRPRDLLS